jgi:hypothetical protein
MAAEVVRLACVELFRAELLQSIAAVV